MANKYLMEKAASDKAVKAAKAKEASKDQVKAKEAEAKAKAKIEAEEAEVRAKEARDVADKAKEEKAEAKKAEEEEAKESIKITSQEITIISSVDLNFKGFSFKKDKKNQFTAESFDALCEKISNIKLFIKKGIIKIV